jgi:isoleucyl-tRNA synthetase
VRRNERAGLKVLNEGNLTLALDTLVTPELLAEGYVRDLVRGVQNLRKESGLEVTDRIILAVGGSPELDKALQAFRPFVAGETLADSILWSETLPEGATEIEAGEKTWKVVLKKK